MKVLILSCNTGGGHNSAASAICAYFEKMDCECDIVNALDFLPKARAELISRGHELAYKYTPRLYGVGYRISEMTPQSRMYEQNAKGADELCKVLFSGSYDVVISVHIFAAMMMTELRINREINIPSFFVATDYTCSPGVSEIVADKYFIPHEKLREEFVSQGIPANRIVASGIPVREEFCRRSDKKAARRALGMSEEGRVLLLCCGSMGCGPIRSIALRLGEIMDENDSLVIVCGSNRQLEKDLQFLTGDDIRIKICGFTDKMSLYMDAADLIITKAGGLSTTEAVMKRLPILFIDAVPGCESRNIEFMTGNAYALESDTASGMAHLVETCLSGAVDPMEMVRRREDDFPFEAAKTIYDTVCDEYRRFDASRSDNKAKPEEKPSRLMPSEEKSMMLIINPVAGKGEMMRSLAEVTGTFMDAGYRVSFYPTRGRGDAAEYVKVRRGGAPVRLRRRRNAQRDDIRHVRRRDRYPHRLYAGRQHERFRGVSRHKLRRHENGEKNRLRQGAPHRCRQAGRQVFHKRGRLRSVHLAAVHHAAETEEQNGLLRLCSRRHKGSGKAPERASAHYDKRADAGGRVYLRRRRLVKRAGRCARLLRAEGRRRRRTV